MKDGKTIELQEVSLRHSRVDSIGLVKNFYLMYDEIEDDGYYQRTHWPNLYFDTRRAVLRPRSMIFLDTIAIILRAEPRLRIEIEGHADQLEASRGQPNPGRYLMQLGEQRAAAAINYLRRSGVPTDCLRRISYGSRRPAAPSDTPENRRFNRRIEVKAVYEEGEEIENGYGDLKLKYSDLLKASANNSSQHETHSLETPAKKHRMQNHAATPTPAKKAKPKSSSSN